MKNSKKKEENKLDEALEESFPASDPVSTQVSLAPKPVKDRKKSIIDKNNKPKKTSEAV